MQSKNPLRIYLVDDDDMMINLMTCLLENEGHQVFSNQSSSRALKDILERRPNCVITDLMMSGVDGLELTRELRYHAPSDVMKIILITGNTKEVWRRKAEMAGVDGYITKPLSQETFAAEIEAIASRKRWRKRFSTGYTNVG